jgi:phosphatidylglycerophosphatase A
MAATSTNLSTQKVPVWAWIVATFFGTGFGKPGPGTWASMAATLIWAGLGRYASPGARPAYAFGGALAATLLGIPAATRVARALGRKDPSHVVIDEVAGQMLTFVFVPLNWRCLLAGLILFRAFDITKPFPVRRLERLPEGTGIMLDDIGAGLYALAVMQLLLHLGLLK